MNKSNYIVSSFSSIFNNKDSPVYYLPPCVHINATHTALETEHDRRVAILVNMVPVLLFPQFGDQCSYVDLDLLIH